MLEEKYVVYKTAPLGYCFRVDYFTETGFDSIRKTKALYR